MSWPPFFSRLVGAEEPPDVRLWSYSPPRPALLFREVTLGAKVTPDGLGVTISHEDARTYSGPVPVSFGWGMGSFGIWIASSREDLEAFDNALNPRRVQRVRVVANVTGTSVNAVYL